jgi:hypothetical protein
MTTPGYWTPTTAPRPGRGPVNTFAWLGLAISVSGFLIPLGVNGLLGAAFSVIGMREARRLRTAGHTDTGSGIALAGLITGIVNVVAMAALAVGVYLLAAWFIDWMNAITSQVR